jgi:DNA-binding beta-propeller fold protein YncE
MRIFGLAILVCAGLLLVGISSAAGAKPIAYAAGPSRVWWLDVSRLEVVGSTALDAPGPIAVKRDGSALYVGLQSQRPPFRIVAVNTEDNTTELLAELPGVPTGLALSPDGRRLWVAHRTGRVGLGNQLFGVSVIDVYRRDVRTVTGFDPSFDALHDIVTTPNGEKVYVTNSFGFDVIDARSTSVTGSIGIPCCVGGGMAIAPDGTTVYALGNEFLAGFVGWADTATDRGKNSVEFYGQDPDRQSDFETDLEIGLDNATAYVAADLGIPRIPNGGNVLIFDTVNVTVSETLALKAVPRSIALTPGDRFALLTTPDDQSVAVVDLTSRRVSGYIPVPEPVYEIATSRTCIGDCGSTGGVSIPELIQGVRIALGLAAIEDCTSMDRDADDRVTIDEITVAVGNALEGC